MDPLERPPSSIKAFYKRYQKINLASIDSDPNILDLARQPIVEQGNQLSLVGHVQAETIKAACSAFSVQNATDHLILPKMDIPIFECRSVPGLLFIQSLLPQQTQRVLLSRLLHDVLADQRHKTNVNAHHKIPQDIFKKEEIRHKTSEEALKAMRRDRLSFFDIAPTSADMFQPLDPAVHRPLNMSQFLNKKLRWIDLGGQYDWTSKVYDTSDAPPFPDDIAQLMSSFFPDTRPEVAIVNLYSPGDTLNVHRDVSECSTNGLVSVSLGCDAIFVIGLERDNGQVDNVALRLRSGDAVYMSQSARYAWHGVPQILPRTCPKYLSDWPAEPVDRMAQNEIDGNRYENWRGWMSNKRINLNIRQLNKK